MPDPAVPAPGARLAFATGVPNKVHHTYIWLGSLLGVLAAFFVAALSALDDLATGLAYANSRGIPILLVVGLVILGFIVAYGLLLLITLLAYKHLSYVFDEKEFSLYSGILTRRRVHVPYTRVQSVNHRQSLVQRLAGVCTVEIDTAGGSMNKAIKVPYVKLDVGEAIRTELFTRKSLSLGAEQAQAAQAAPAVPGTPMPQQLGGAVQANVLDEAAIDMGVDNFRGVYGGAFTGLEPVSFERRMDNRELMLASVSHSGVTGALVAMVFTIAAVVTSIIAAVGVVGSELYFAIPIAVVSLIAIFVFTIAVTIGTTALSFGSFSVRRRGSRIEVERGILQRDFSGIDVNRIQSVVVRQSFIRRLLGYCEVSLGRIRAGSAEDQNTQATLNAGGLVVHPFLKIDQVNGLLAGLLPEFSDRPAPQDFKGLPDVALRRGIVRRCIVRNALFWIAIGAVVCHIVAVVLTGMVGMPTEALSIVVRACIACYILFVLSLAPIALGTLWWKRGSGFAINRGYAAICNDGLGTETTYLPRSKIQDVLTRTNPFQRSAGVTTLEACSAAGVGGSIVGLWDVTAEDGQAWLDWLKPRTTAAAAPSDGAHSSVVQ